MPASLDSQIPLLLGTDRCGLRDVRSSGDIMVRVRRTDLSGQKQVRDRIAHQPYPRESTTLSLRRVTRPRLARVIPWPRLILYGHRCEILVALVVLGALYYQPTVAAPPIAATLP